MSEVRIEGQEYAVGKIFSDDFEFTIPGYQRPYSWDTEKAEALLNDLLSALGNENKKIEDIDSSLRVQAIFANAQTALKQPR